MWMLKCVFVLFFRIAEIKLGGVGVILFCWLCFHFFKVVLVIVVLMRYVFFTFSSQKRETWTYDCGKLINQSLKIELGQTLQESKGRNLMNMCILLRLTL